MYEKDKVSVNWFKLGLKLLIVILTVILLYKIVTIIRDNKTNVIEKDEMQEKLTDFAAAGDKYLEKKDYPTTSGESITIYLKDLIQKDLLEEIKDNKGDICDGEKSYIKVTKLDKEYQFKTYLSCPNFEDYKNSFIPITQEIEEKTTTTKVVTTTKKKTTKAVKKYTISFNTNGGNHLDDISVKENTTIGSLNIPTRIGYKFIGWYYHGTRLDESTAIKQDYVLVAKWVRE